MRLKQNKHSIFATDEQNEWVSTTRAVMQTTPPALDLPPAHPFRALCFNMASSARFNSFFMR
jgi:hypothetical protein